MHKIIQVFNPDVEVLDHRHQDLLCKCRFSAGENNLTFNEFISKEECYQFAQDGNGVTYLVFDKRFNEDKEEELKKLIAYYTLSTTSIPYIDRIRLEPDEQKLSGREFDEQTCGIPAVEIKMFAVSKDYQDVFYQYDNESLPVAAWILRNIIDYANELSEKTVGFKAVFLYAVPGAEKFYEDNKFEYVKKYMKPLHSVDSDFKAMYLTLKEVKINYDE